MRGNPEHNSTWSPIGQLIVLPCDGPKNMQEVDWIQFPWTWEGMNGGKSELISTAKKRSSLLDDGVIPRHRWINLSTEDSLWRKTCECGCHELQRAKGWGLEGINYTSIRAMDGQSSQFSHYPIHLRHNIRSVLWARLTSSGTIAIVTRRRNDEHDPVSLSQDNKVEELCLTWWMVREEEDSPTFIGGDEPDTWEGGGGVIFGSIHHPSKLINYCSRSLEMLGSEPSQPTILTLSFSCCPQ